MGQSVEQRLDLLLALLHLAIKFISLSLELFLYLLALDHIVGLGVVALSLSTARLVFANKTLIFDSQVFDHVGSLLKLNFNLMSLGLGSLILRNQDVFVNLDFSLTFLHRHLELVLSVFETVHFVSSRVDLLAKTLDLKLHDVMLDKSLLLALNDSLEVTSCHLVLELKLSND